jgi:hypothetical protein
VVEVEHAHREIANVTVRCAVYVEYLHLVRTREGWRIITVNALRLRGRARPARPGRRDGVQQWPQWVLSWRWTAVTSTASGRPRPSALSCSWS